MKSYFFDTKISNKSIKQEEFLVDIKSMLPDIKQIIKADKLIETIIFKDEKLPQIDVFYHEGNALIFTQKWFSNTKEEHIVCFQHKLNQVEHIWSFEKDKNNGKPFHMLELQHFGYAYSKWHVNKNEEKVQIHSSISNEWGATEFQFYLPEKLHFLPKTLIIKTQENLVDTVFIGESKEFIDEVTDVNNLIEFYNSFGIDIYNLHGTEWNESFLNLEKIISLNFQP